MRRFLKWAAWVVGISFVIALFWGHATLMASLPMLDGAAEFPALSAPVQIERDDLGVPTISASNRLDLARAIGWLHGQERFFQMDLLRRQAAGELAELFGPAALDSDRKNRVHRFRRRAVQDVARMSDVQRAILEAYCEGVNSGLAALGASPPEYMLLRAEPVPWRPEDSGLTILSMYLLLQGGGGRRESSLGLMHDLLPPELFEFLVPGGTEWDAPMMDGLLPAAPIPGPEVVDLRSGATAADPALTDELLPVDELPTGSNAWAVAGWRTAGGLPLLANDMHLPLALPNTWYRAAFRTLDESVTGFTIPGVPVMVAGSNGHVAWGLTSSYVDSSDLVILDIDPDDPDRYLTPDGYKSFERHEEMIAVKGREEVRLGLLYTIWGPVIDRDHLGRRRALRWVAHEPGASSLRAVELERARSLEVAIAIAQQSVIPTLNVVIADNSGRIGWTLTGLLPNRRGFGGRLPSSWSDGNRGWDGMLDGDRYPEIIDPESGLVWSANNRAVGGAMLELIGDSGYDLGARARQIRDDLLALDGATVADMLAIQLDDRALFLARWRELLLECLTPEALSAEPRREILRRLAEEDWTGHASVDSAGYRMVRAFRLYLAEQLFVSILSGYAEDPGQFSYMRTSQWEGPLWRLVSEQPIHLLDARYADWQEQMLAGADAVIDHFLDEENPDLAGRTWGKRNMVSVAHPLSYGVPMLGRWLNLEPRALPGDSHMPRVQSPSFGASERMVVSPGHEAEGIAHMPGGQSGHFLSPFYGKGHDAWEAGEPTPFLPGPAAHRLTLSPR
jgi:penicillin amidase